MPPVARTLQEPVELPRGILFALLIEHNADDGRRALRCHRHIYGFGWCGRHTAAAAIGSAGPQPRAVVVAYYEVFLHWYQLEQLKNCKTRALASVLHAASSRFRVMPTAAFLRSNWEQRLGSTCFASLAL